MTPEDIYDQAVYVVQVARDRDAAADELQVIEDMITTNVLGERDASGKAVYTNETSRAIAIRQLCRDTAKWRQAKDALDAKELVKAMEAAKLELYRNRFAVMKLYHRRETANMEAVKE